MKFKIHNIDLSLFVPSRGKEDKGALFPDEIITALIQEPLERVYPFITVTVLPVDPAFQGQVCETCFNLDGGIISGVHGPGRNHNCSDEIEKKGNEWIMKNKVKIQKILHLMLLAYEK